jgi:hypothetical protein
MHRIRLRSPWNAEQIEQTYCLSRTFHLPTGLLPRDVVHLLIDHVASSATVLLNCFLLGNIEPGQHFAGDITTLLQSRNILEIKFHDLAEIPLQASLVPGALLGEVQIGIESMA